LESIPKLHSEVITAHLEANDGSVDVKSLAQAVQKSVKPVNNTALPPAYRKKMVRVLTKRALQALGELR